MTDTLADRSLDHDNRVRFTRRYYPLFVLLFAVCLIGWAQLQRLLVLQQLVAFVRAELSEIEDGFIETLDFATNGDVTKREISFEHMKGTGLSGSPLRLGVFEFELSQGDEIQYTVTSQDAVMDVTKGAILSPGLVRIEGPDGLTVESESASLDLATFSVAGQGKVLAFADGGISISADQGMVFDTETSELVLFGKTSAKITSNFPDLQ